MNKTGTRFAAIVLSSAMFGTPVLSILAAETSDMVLTDSRTDANGNLVLTDSMGNTYTMDAYGNLYTVDLDGNYVSYSIYGTTMTYDSNGTLLSTAPTDESLALPTYDLYNDYLEGSEETQNTEDWGDADAEADTTAAMSFDADDISMTETYSIAQDSLYDTYSTDLPEEEAAYDAYDSAETDSLYVYGESDDTDTAQTADSEDFAAAASDSNDDTAGDVLEEADEAEVSTTLPSNDYGVVYNGEGTIYSNQAYWGDSYTPTYGNNVALQPDFSSSAWNDPTNPFNTSDFWGQCTWFSWCRFKEIYGYDPGFTGDGYENAGEIVANYPDSFYLDTTPVSGAVFSSDAAHNHTGIVLWADASGQNLVIQEGNLDGVTNDYDDALQDYWTRTVTLDELRANYGDVVFANPAA